MQSDNYSDINKVKIIKIDSDLLIQDIYFEHEKNKALKFYRNSDSKYFWIPKSVIKEQRNWIKDQLETFPVKFPIDLYWKGRNKIEQIRFEREKKLKKLGYMGHTKKTYLFYKNIGKGSIYADLRGTRVVSFKRDTRTLVYYQNISFNNFMKEVALLERNECKPRGTFHDTDELEGMFCVLDGMMPDGYCISCEKNIINSVDWDAILPDWDSLGLGIMSERRSLYTVFLCESCKKQIPKKIFDELLDNWNKGDNLGRFECLECGSIKEDFLPEDDIPPVCDKCEDKKLMILVKNNFKVYLKKHILIEKQNLLKNSSMPDDKEKIELSTDFHKGNYIKDAIFEKESNTHILVYKNSEKIYSKWISKNLLRHWSKETKEPQDIYLKWIPPNYSWERNFLSLDEIITFLNEKFSIISIYGIGSYFDDKIPSNWIKNDIDLIIVAKNLDEVPFNEKMTARFILKKIGDVEVFMGFNTIAGAHD